MAELNALAASASAVTIACCQVKGAVYAIEVACVREIVGMVEITPLPNAPRLIEGVIDLRGSLIPVIDLARVLNLGDGSTDERVRIVVLDFEGLSLGLWVDAATEVLTVEARRLEAVPELATHAGHDFVRSVIRRDGASPIMVLSLETLIEKVTASARSLDAEKELV
jgi:purine-binding chemotaxis protein CheW